MLIACQKCRKIIDEAVQNPYEEGIYGTDPLTKERMWFCNDCVKRARDKEKQKEQTIAGRRQRKC